MRSAVGASGSLAPPCGGRWRAAASSPSRMIPTCPFQNTRSPRRSGAPACERAPDQRRLHVRIARGRAAAGEQRELDEARAVDAAGAAPAPEVGHAEEPLGLGDEVARDRGEVGARHVAAAAQPGEAAGRAADRHLGEVGQVGQHRAARRRGRIDVRPERGDPPAAALRPAEAARRHVADVAVERRLAPGQAVLQVVDGEALAVQELGRALGAGRRDRASGRAAPR